MMLLYVKLKIKCFGEKDLTNALFVHAKEGKKYVDNICADYFNYLTYIQGHTRSKSK